MQLRLLRAADITRGITGSFDKTPVKMSPAGRQFGTSNFEGNSGKADDVFTVRFDETFITVKIIELIPIGKIGWQVVDCYKHWLKDKKEWKDTTMSWEISTGKNATQINFTHISLVPGIECYNGCKKAWKFYINENLFKLLTGKKNARII